MFTIHKSGYNIMYAAKFAKRLVRLCQERSQGGSLGGNKFLTIPDQKYANNGLEGLPYRIAGMAGSSETQEPTWFR